MIFGGTLEKYGIFCDGTLPTVKCDLPTCDLESDGSANLVKGFGENPNYLGCQGPCRRWFHAFCMGYNYRKYVYLSQQEFWKCNRFDCKKK